MAAVEKKRKEEAAQIYGKIEHLKSALGKKKSKDCFNEVEIWSEMQEMQTLSRDLFLLDIEYALDKKVEVDLWNFCFKEYINHLQSASRDRAPSRRKSASQAQTTLTWFLEMSHGYYLSLLRSIQEKFNLDLPFLRSESVFGLGRESEELDNRILGNCYYLSSHILIRLGDIARYRSQHQQSELFYRQAIKLSPGSGQAYNQIALLEGNKGNKLSAAFFYARSIALNYPFPSAAANLNKLFASMDIPKHTSNLKINTHNFVPVSLSFFSLIHQSRHLNRALKLCHLLIGGLTSIIASDSLSSWQLIQLITVDLFLLDKCAEDLTKLSYLCEEEKEVLNLVCDYLSGMLNALLLPVYTLKQGEMLLAYPALPAVKIVMEFLVTRPRLLKEKAFLKRLQIWPSFARMLNELKKVTGDEKDSLENLAEFPLPEDVDLQEFLPLAERFKLYNCKKISRSAKSTIPKEQQDILRALRLIDLGKTFASNDFPGGKLLIAKDNSTFEAVEQTVPEDLVKDLDSIDLATSDEEEDDLANIGPDSMPEKTPEPTKEEKPSEEKKTTKRAGRNVAMAAILKQAAYGPRPQESKQVKFQESERPKPQDEKRLQNFYTPPSTNRPLPPPRPNFSVPPPQVRPVRSLGMIQPRIPDQNPWSQRPSLLPTPPASNLQSLLTLGGPMGLERQFPHERQNSGVATLFGAAPNGPAGNGNMPSYSLFSGPSWSARSGNGDQRRPPTSALEKLLQDQNKKM